MKTCIKDLLLLPALIALLGWIPAGRVAAQTFTTLYSFTAWSGSYPYFNSDGMDSDAGLTLSGNTLYGTASEGGPNGNGTVFAVNTNGTGFTNLHSFTAASGSAGVYSNGTNSDGATPVGGLILSGNTLYGTAFAGGPNGNGTVFAVQTDGTGFTNLYSFTASSTNSSGVYTNSDGANPHAGLVLSGDTLYGTASGGGTNGNGTVFAVHTDGAGFTTLYAFTATDANGHTSDGAGPDAGLFLSGNTLYGTASFGGNSGFGAVFAVNTDGTGFTNLHSFTALIGGWDSDGWSYTNSDGAFPHAGLILLGNTLYGTAFQGGYWGDGAVFAVHTDGTGFTNLHNLNGSWNGVGYGSDGANSHAGLILSGNTLYGTASGGGSSGSGAVFSLSLPPPPQLTIVPSGANVILTWPANNAGFTLQSTTNLVAPAVWSTVSSGPIVIGGQNLVINPVSGTQQFFRLSQ
jgi:uncharacterized repeat protein (TIGR03803 family)